MKQKKLKKAFLSFFLCSLLLLAGCSGSQISKSQPAMKSKATEQAADEENYGSGNQNADEIVTEGDNTMSIDSAADAQQPSKESVKSEEKLVYTCDMTMETLEFSQTIKAIKEQIAKYDGIIEQENESDNNYQWYYTTEKSNATLSSFLVIRIPSEKYEQFLDSLTGNGKITSKNMRVENITKHYSEVETSIKSLKTQEKRLLDMMEQAKTVEDMITVESRLSEVQNELEQYKNTLSALDTDITYSTINLSINEVVKYEESQETFQQRLHNTLGESKQFFFNFLENGLFTLILFGPVLLVLAIVLFIIIAVIGRIRRNKRQKKALKRFQKEIYQNDQIPRSEESQEGGNVTKNE